MISFDTLHVNLVICATVELRSHSGSVTALLQSAGGSTCATLADIHLKSRSYNALVGSFLNKSRPQVHSMCIKAI